LVTHPKLLLLPRHFYKRNNTALWHKTRTSVLTLLYSQ
jgi:hypothetical protein